MKHPKPNPKQNKFANVFILLYEDFRPNPVEKEWIVSYLKRDNSKWKETAIKFMSQVCTGGEFKQFGNAEIHNPLQLEHFWIWPIQTSCWKHVGKLSCSFLSSIYWSKKLKLTPKLANIKIQFSENSIIFTNYGLVFNGIRQNRWDNLRQDLMKIYSI